MNAGNKLLWLAAGAGVYMAARAVAHSRRYFDLQGRSVLITGGSRGLGLVMARQLIQEGALLSICARDSEELERARLQLEALGGTVLALRCDVSDKEQVDQMIRAINIHYGQVDVLINNAGVIEVGPIENQTLEDFEEAMKVNFWGALYPTWAVIPYMRQRREGRIVNICSIGGKISIPHLVPYCTSKFALTALSEGLHAELAKDNIWVTTICPHLMRTGSPANATFKGQHRAEYAWFSISDALPIVSMSAERAARRIIRACKNGEAEVILTLQANIAARFNQLFPGLTSNLLSVVNRMLPGPGGIGTARAKGKESYSALSPSVLTTLGDKAAERNNELPWNGHNR